MLNTNNNASANSSGNTDDPIGAFGDTEKLSLPCHSPTGLRDSLDISNKRSDPNLLNPTWTPASAKIGVFPLREHVSKSDYNIKPNNSLNNFLRPPQEDPNAAERKIKFKKNKSLSLHMPSVKGGSGGGSSMGGGSGSLYEEIKSKIFKSDCDQRKSLIVARNDFKQKLSTVHSCEAGSFWSKVEGEEANDNLSSVETSVENFV
jgi:hypothetical protein